MKSYNYRNVVANLYCITQLIVIVLLLCAFVRNDCKAAETWLWPIAGSNGGDLSRGYTSGHKGVDICFTGIEGHDIRAAKSGVVVQSSNSCPHYNQYAITGDEDYSHYCNGGCGNYVTIDHEDGTKSRYLHMQQGSAIGLGTRVQRGQVIGKVGSSGQSSGPHCHFDIWVNGERINNNPGNISYDFGNPSQDFVSLLDTPAAGKTYSGNVSILGFAMHKNGIDHVTAWVNGNVMACPQYSDPNLTNLCPGSPAGKEGFTGSIPMSFLKDGANTIEVYAYEKNDTPHKIASHSFNYSADKVAPYITNVRISNADDTGYTVNCNIWDDQKVDKVVFVTWTPDKDGFDDKIETTVTTGLEMKDHVASVSFRVNTKDHNNEKGRYATHIYAYDAWGNSDNRLTNAAVGGDYYDPVKSLALNGKVYELYDARLGNWTAAKSYCDSIGGYLVCINSQEEQNIVDELVKDGTRDGYWMGATDQYVEGGWTWVTGEAFDYTNWHSGQPDNHNKAEHYGMVWRGQPSALWNDSPEEVRAETGTGVYGFICERAAVKAGKVYSVTDTGANLSAVFYGSKAAGIQSAGFYLGKTEASLKKYEVVSNPAGNRIAMDAYVNDYAGDLDPDTRYYYQFYFVDKSGQEVKGAVNTFTTENTLEAISQDILANPDKVVEYNGKKYYRFDTKVNHWEVAKRACEAMGGHLATIISSEEKDVIAQLIGGGSIYAYWVGGTDRSKEGIWEWITGEPCELQDWYDDQPDDQNGIEDYLAVYRDQSARWNDTKEYYTSDETAIKGFICEIEEPESYKIAYHLNGGTLKGQNPTSYSSDDNRLDLESPEKEHYIFLGWFDAEDNGRQITKETECKGDLDLYAYWKPEEYTLRLDPNGGTLAGDSEIKAAYGAAYGELPVPVREGYSFEGWYSGETRIDGETVCSSNINAQARWKAVEVIITFDCNGGKALSPSTITVIYDSAYGDLPKAERDGYVFQGWYLQKDGGEQILPTSTVRNAKDHILYAHWEEEETPSHVHSYNEKVTKKATCAEDGLKTFTCSDCGEYYTEVIPALGHSYSDWKATKEPTCQKEGEEQRICEKCGTVEKRSLEKTGHQYDAEIIAPTCKSFGYTIHTCKTCGDTYKDSYRNYADHTVVTDKAVNPTCSSTGLTEGSHCSICGTILTVQKTLPKKEHRYDAGVVTKESTCKEHGCRTYICQDCGDVKEESLSLSAHKEVTDPAIAPTCTLTGLTEGSHCSVCEEVLKAQESIPKKDHRYDAGAVTKESTCKEHGCRTYTCQDCGDIKEETLPLSAHKIVIDPAVEPTTSSTGLTEGSHCSVCGEVIKAQQVISKKAEGSTEKPAETEKPPVSTDPNHPAVEEKEKQITNQKNDGDPKGSAYGLLCAKVKKSSKTANTLGWERVAGASGYVVYGNRCGTTFRFVKLAEVKGTSYIHKELKKGTYYKYLVVAYKNISGGKIVITTSKTIHAVTAGGKVGNCKKLKLNKTKVIIKRNGSFKLKAKEIPAGKNLKIKQHRKIAFESNNPKVAVVTKAGEIKGLKKGSCKIYVYAQNGIYKAVTVKVK